MRTDTREAGKIWRHFKGKIVRQGFKISKDKESAQIQLERQFQIEEHHR